jgi:hypothetical protein
MKARIHVVFIVIALLCFGLTISMAQVLSNGTGGGDWDTGTTWLLGSVPQSTDNVVIQGSDIVTLLAAGTCANLTMNAGTTLSLNSTGLSIPGTSWNLATTSTVIFNGPTTVQSAPVYGNLTYSSANGGPNGSLTVLGNLSVTGTATLRGIATPTGSFMHNISGDVVLSNASAKISAVNNSSGTTATCVWSIGGSVKLTGNSSNNRLILYESAGPHTGSATYNINGNLEIGSTSQVMFKSSSATSNNYPEGIINLKGNFVQDGTISSNSVTSGTSPGLTINMVGTTPQVWSGSGTFSVSSVSGFPVKVNIDNASGVTLGANRTFNNNTGLAITKGAISLSTFTLSYSGYSTKLIYNGSSAQTTTSAEFPTTPPKYLVINNSSGVTLHEARTISDTLVLTSGKLATTSINLLTMGSAGIIQSASPSSFVDGPLAHTWTAATAIKTYPIGSGSDYRPIVVSLTNPASPVLQMQLVNSNAGGDKGSLDAISIVRYYQSSLLSGTATNGGAVKLYYGADDGVQTAANLVVVQSTTANGTYASLGTSGYDVDYVTSDNLYNPASGDFLLIGSTGGNVLPVEMTSFTASATGNSAILRWSTAMEVRSARFDIERRFQGTSTWKTVGSVNAAGTSNSAKEYCFEDRNLAPGVYIYRLIQIDNDGTFKYSASAEVAALATPSAPRALTLHPNFPNPFNPTTEIKFCVPADGYTTLKVYNMLGQEIATLFDGMAVAGEYIQKKFDASRLSSGVYFSRLQSNGKSLIQRMLLTK